MATRRMFNKKITETDAFLDMPMSTQCLYFHLNMSADDDGFIGNVKTIKRMIGASDDDVRLLITKNFIIPFESGVVVIKDWKIHNYIQKDRYNTTMYKEEKSQLIEGKNKEYQRMETMDTKCIQNVHEMDTQVRDRVRLELDNKKSKDFYVITDDEVIKLWNSLSLQKLVSITGTRKKLLNARLKEYGKDNFIKAIENIRQSSFLQGQNNKSWIITFDWLIKPNNFVKVLENNYADKQQEKGVTNAGTTDKPKQPYTSKYDSKPENPDSWKYADYSDVI